MHKLAIFVEGYTELIFIARLVEELAGKNNVIIEQRKIRGGGQDHKTRRTYAEVTATRPATLESLYVLIVDCGGDKLVKTRIQEEHENLSRKGYEKIIGMRDVRPDFSLADIPQLELGLRKYIKSSLIPVVFILTVMEVEAWFLAEHTHFPKIDPSITTQAIHASLGFNPETEDMSSRETPTTDLQNSYRIAQREYVKSAAKETVDVLDFDFLYANLQQRIPYLAQLFENIEVFINSANVPAEAA